MMAQFCHFCLAKPNQTEKIFKYFWDFFEYSLCVSWNDFCFWFFVYFQMFFFPNQISLFYLFFLFILPYPLILLLHRIKKIWNKPQTNVLKCSWSKDSSINNPNEEYYSTAQAHSSVHFAVIQFNAGKCFTWILSLFPFFSLPLPPKQVSFSLFACLCLFICLN